MVRDYSEHALMNTIGIVTACLEAGRPERIGGFLLDHRSAAGVEAELAATRPTRAPASAQSSASINDALAAAVEKRFRAQNARA